MVSPEHPLRIRESLWIPDKVAPFIGVHPVAVKMEYMKRDLPVCHSLYKAGSSLLIIVCSKGSCQPKAERPGRRQSRFAGKIRIFFHCSHGAAAADKVIIQPLPFHGKLYPLYLFAGNLKCHISHIVHQNAISFICNIKRNILIGDLAGSSSVLIPHFYDLSIFHKGSKPFSKAIDIFVHINRKLLQHIGFLCLIVIHVSQIPEAGLSKEFLTLIESQLISGRSLVDHCFQRSGTVDYLGVCLCDLYLGIFLVHLGKRSFIQRPCMMYR